MTAAIGEPLRRLAPAWDRIARILSSAALKALIGAHIIVAAIIMVRSYGWLQPFELLIYDGLRVAWAGSAPSNTVLLVGGTEADVEDFDWPLKDGDLADLLERIASWQPRVIGVDIYRDHPKRPAPSGWRRFSPGTRKSSGPSSSKTARSGRSRRRRTFAARTAPPLPIS